MEIIYYLKNFKNLERVSFSTDLTENNFAKIKEMSEKLDAHTLLLFWQFTIETMDEVNIVNEISRGAQVEDTPRPIRYYLCLLIYIYI